MQSIVKTELKSNGYSFDSDMRSFKLGIPQPARTFNSVPMSEKISSLEKIVRRMPSSSEINNCILRKSLLAMHSVWPVSVLAEVGRMVRWVVVRLWQAGTDLSLQIRAHVTFDGAVELF